MILVDEVIQLNVLKQVKIWFDMTVKELVEEMSYAGFQAVKLADSVRILTDMIQDKRCTKFLGLAGALIPGGMRTVIVEMIRNHFIDVIVTTGANLTHDLIEAFGEHHYQEKKIVNDAQLYKSKINRIYNVLLPNKGYVSLENNLAPVFSKLPQKEMSSKEFIFELGNKIEDENSIIKAATDENVPIFCPSISDSILGFQIWMYSQDHKLMVNPTLDQKDMLDIAFDSKRSGALIIGGGVPKHYIAMTMQTTPKALDYAVQITMDRPESGGVSGAKLEEAKSWKKVAVEAEVADLICDATIALPIIVASLLSKKLQN